MPIIITTHMAHNNAMWGASQRSVIIHAADPDIEPYMSRLIGTIHAQQAAATAKIAAKAGKGPEADRYDDTLTADVIAGASTCHQRKS